MPAYWTTRLSRGVLYTKNEGLAVFRKPLGPLFKVCDIRATIDGIDIFMFVDYNTDSVALLNKVTVSSGSWELYSNILGQNLITTKFPQKIVAGSDYKLADGENIFYILLKDDSGDISLPQSATTITKTCLLLLA